MADRPFSETPNTMSNAIETLTARLSDALATVLPAGADWQSRLAPIVEATEASGFTGLYSIELLAETGAPADPFTASRAMIEQILPGLRNTAARPAKPNNFSISS